MLTNGHSIFEDSRFATQFPREIAPTRANLPQSSAKSQKVLGLGYRYPIETTGKVNRPSLIASWCTAKRNGVSKWVPARLGASWILDL